MRKMSPQRAAEMRAESPARQAWLRFERRCQVRVLGGFVAPPCSIDLHVHEPWARGRGGPTDDPRNMATSCDWHNEWISQDPDGQAFGYANNLLVHDYEGAAWLAKGGRFPGKSVDQLLELLGIDPKERE